MNYKRKNIENEKIEQIKKLKEVFSPRMVTLL
jgi:hypothetical protein